MTQLINDQQPGASTASSERIKPARQLLRQLRLAEPRQRLDHFCKREVVLFLNALLAGGSGDMCLLGRPHQRDGLREIADVIVGKLEQNRIGSLGDQAADQTGFGVRKTERSGERRKRPAALWIAGGAKIIDHQPQLVVAAWFVSEAIEQLGKTIHEVSSPPSSPSSSP